MTEVNAVVRQWGDSLAIIIPKEVVRKEKIKAQDTIHVIVNKGSTLCDLFGSLKIKKSAQQLKDESRKSWK